MLDTLAMSKQLTDAGVRPEQANAIGQDPVDAAAVAVKEGASEAGATVARHARRRDTPLKLGVSSTCR